MKAVGLMRRPGMTDSRTNFAILSCATHSSKCLAAHSALGWAADPDLPASEPLRALLGCNGAHVARPLARAKTRDITVHGRNQAAAGESGSRFRSRIRVRNFVVSRHLLLDLRHHAPVRRP